ncbi:MAG: hypothetical protein IKH10_02995, partial [Bacteroidetes bacterium]|nr:hypothetical protein [Bacteroidota bacterium]
LSDDKYNFSNVKINSFVLFDETIEVTNMTDMFIKVIKMLYDKNPNIIHNEIVSEDSSYILSKKDRDLFINNNPDKANEIKPIVKDRIYINVHSSNIIKITRLRNLFDKYELKYGSDEISQDDLIFIIKEKQIKEKQ